jgi:DNA-binding IclR family transcriptional regulator
MLINAHTAARVAPSATDESVAAVLRAVGLLDAFRLDDDRLSLATLSRRAGVPKTTALRLARTLRSVGYLVQLDDGAWRLGPATARLAARYQTAFDLQNMIEPALHRLAKSTRESSSFFAHDGSQRVRLLRVHGAHPLALVTPVGEALPLDKGSPGKVILAAIGRRGALYDEIRQRGFHMTFGETRASISSVAAPVYGRKRAVLGSICISMPTERATKSETSLSRHAPDVVGAARRLSQLLGTPPADASGADAMLAASSWHP